MLPDGNGFELMETLRSFTNIPVIFLTAKDDIQDKYSGFGLGADDYITKPFMPKELIDRLFDLNLEQKWYDYRDRAYERIAKEWCEKYNIDCCDIIT